MWSNAEKQNINSTIPHLANHLDGTNTIKNERERERERERGRKPRLENRTSKRERIMRSHSHKYFGGKNYLSWSNSDESDNSSQQKGAEVPSIEANDDWLAEVYPP